VLDGLNTLILDEADRMLDMGFYDAIEDIIGKTPARRQTLLFSATYPVGIKQLAAKFMRNPQQGEGRGVPRRHADRAALLRDLPEERMSAVTKVLRHFRPASCVAFCFTKQQCRKPSTT
jgi:ATP-independent RNA helicase DbpA